MKPDTLNGTKNLYFNKSMIFKFVQNATMPNDIVIRQQKIRT